MVGQRAKRRRVEWLGHVTKVGGTRTDKKISERVYKVEQWESANLDGWKMQRMI
jgi:hypothetical protein